MSNTQISNEDPLELFELAISPKVTSIDEFKSLLQAMEQNFPEDVEVFYSELLKGVIPKAIPRSIVRSNSEYGLLASLLHQNLQRLGYYGRATKNLALGLKELTNGGKVLDPMAGAGHMTLALREQGVPTIATDNNSGVVKSPFEKLDALDSLRKYGNECNYLLLSWPSGDPVDAELLRVMREEFPHMLLIHFGEYKGCTGSQEFWELVSPYDSLYVEVEYETTFGLYDELYIFN